MAHTHKPWALTSFSASMSLNCFMRISRGTTARCRAACTSASMAASLLLSICLGMSFFSSLLLVSSFSTLHTLSPLSRLPHPPRTPFQLSVHCLTHPAHPLTFSPLPYPPWTPFNFQSPASPTLWTFSPLPHPPWTPFNFQSPASPTLNTL